MTRADVVSVHNASQAADLAKGNYRRESKTCVRLRKKLQAAKLRRGRCLACFNGKKLALRRLVSKFARRQAKAAREVAPESQTPAASARPAVAPESQTPAAPARPKVAPESQTPAASARPAVAAESQTPSAPARPKVAPESQTPAASARPAVAPATQNPAASARPAAAPGSQNPADAPESDVSAGRVLCSRGCRRPHNTRGPWCCAQCVGTAGPHTNYCEAHWHER